MAIPSWDNISKHYEQRFGRKKSFKIIKGNFFSLVERFASGKQEIYQLCAPDRREKSIFEHS